MIGVNSTDDELSARRGRPFDFLYEIFDRQTAFMEMLKAKDRFFEWPVNLASKDGQARVKECVFNCIAELMEATVELKNKAHRLTDVGEVDQEHYHEELVDAFSFFIEACIISGMTADDLYYGFVDKNAIVKQRLQNGY